MKLPWVVAFGAIRTHSCHRSARKLWYQSLSHQPARHNGQL